MKPSDKGTFPSETTKTVSGLGRCQDEQRTKKKEYGRNVKRRKNVLDEEREYHVILWGATGFAGRFAAEYLAHYYMKHEDPSLYAFKSSAFPPVCPVEEEAAGSGKEHGTKPTSKSVHLSGFLPTGLTPGEHKPEVTPPIGGASFSGTIQSDFKSLLPGPEFFSRPDRSLGAQVTPLTSECKSSIQLPLESAASTYENKKILAQREGTSTKTTTAPDASKQRACPRRADTIGPTYVKDKASTCPASSHLQGRIRSDCTLPFTGGKGSSNLMQNACDTESLHKGYTNGRNNQVFPRTLLPGEDATEARRTARRRQEEGMRGKGRSQEIKNEHLMAQKRERRDREGGGSSLATNYNRSGTGKKVAARGQRGGVGKGDRKDRREVATFNVTDHGKDRESEPEARERMKEKLKVAEQDAEREKCKCEEEGSGSGDPCDTGETTTQHEDDAGAESGNENEQGKGNSSAEHSRAAGARPKGAHTQAPEQRNEVERGRRTSFQRLKACSCLVCDLALTPASSSSVSSSCLETASLSGTSAREKIKFALAGRSMDKLRRLRYQLAERLGRHCMRIDLIAVNPGDEEAMEKLCRRGRVLLSTCGPYRLCGEPIVKACISARTHYCDITAEVSYVADMAAKYHAAAVEKKLKLLFFCGAVSLPSDLTVLMTQREALRMRGIPCHEIRTAVTDCFGGFSGGSIMGLGHIFEDGAVFDPFFLVKYASPSPPSKQELLPYVRPQIFLAKHDEDFGYCAYNVLAPLSENVVRFSSALLGLYTRQEFHGDARSAERALRSSGKGDAVSAATSQHRTKKGNATFQSSSPSSPHFAMSPAVSPGSHEFTSSKSSSSSSSKCPSARSYISSSASNSPSSHHSPSFFPTTCLRRRSSSLPSSPPSPSSQISDIFGSCASRRAAASSFPRGKPVKPDAETAVSATATTPANTATPTKPRVPSRAPAGASARRTACPRVASAIDIFSPLRTESSFFHYSECVALGYDVLTASVVSVITFILMFLVTSSFCRAALTALHIFPRPGEGPPRQFLDKGHFQIKTVGRVYPSDDKKIPVCCMPIDDDEEEAEKEQERRFYKPPHCHDRETVITVTMGSASGDPGYKETGKMLVETGLAIALHIEDCFELCGVCTPASGVGLVLVDRLRRAGMKFEVKVKQF